MSDYFRKLFQQACYWMSGYDRNYDTRRKSKAKDRSYDHSLAELMAEIKEKSITISSAVAELEKLLANIN